MTTLTTTKGPGLLDPLRLGALQLPNRGDHGPSDPLPGE